MKKLFTLMMLLLCAVVNMQAEDVTLFSADFSQSPWAGHVFTHDEDFNGIYCCSKSDASNCGSISSDGILSYMGGGNKNSNRYFAIKLSGINKTFKVTITMDGKKKMRYSIGEESEYSGSTANTNTDWEVDNTGSLDYTMTGDGTDAIFYFGQQGSKVPNGIKSITITTPNASDVITYEITEVTVNGTALSSTDLETLSTSKALTIADAMDGLPIVQYSSKTYTNGVETASVTNKGVDVVEEEGNYKATITLGGENYVLTFTNVTIISVLTVRGTTDVVLNKANITSKDYLAASTNNWNEGKTYAGYSGDFYNMSSEDRYITIKVTGASGFEVYVQNTNAGRGYQVEVATISKTIAHNATGVESSGYIPIPDPSSETTITIKGTGNSVYPVHVLFEPTRSIEFPADKKMISYSVDEGIQLDLSKVEGLTAYIATDVTAESVKLAETKGMYGANGYILEGTAGATYEIPVVDEAPEHGKNCLHGTNANPATVEAKSVYVLSDGKFKTFTGTVIPANKAYLTIGEVGFDPGDFGGARELTLVFGDEATGIDSVTRDALTNGKIYNLQGQEVRQAKGIVIMNGKKVIMK